MTEYENQLGREMRKYEDNNKTLYSWRHNKRCVGSRYVVYQMNAPINFGVINHTEGFVDDYEGKLETFIGRRKIVKSVLARQSNAFVQAQLRILSAWGEQISWPMLALIKWSGNIWNSNKHFQKLDSSLVA